MRHSLGSRAVVLAAACAITTAACDNRHLVGDADAGSTGAAGTGMTGAAGTGMTGAAGTGMTGAAGTGVTAAAGTSGTGFAGTSGTGFAGTSGTGFAGTSGTGFAGTSGTGFAGMSGTCAAGESGACEYEFLLPISARDALRRATAVLWGAPSDDAKILPPDDPTKGPTPKTNLDLGPSIRELFKDPRARLGLGAFYRWWLGLDGLATTKKDATLYPQFTPDLARSMATETETFGVNVTLDGDGLYFTLMQAPFSYIDDRLAAIYGVSGVLGPAFRKVAVDPKKRAGILTQPAIMALYSPQTRTSPSARGSFVQRQVLCRVIPAPPPNEPPLAPTFPPNVTTRQALEALVGQNAACTACHRLIDPIGYVYEGLDAIGRVRTSDNGRPVDTTGSFIDANADPAEVAVDGAVAFAERLSGSAMGCFGEQWMRFALGRPLVDADQPWLQFAVSSWVGEGGGIRVLISEVLRSRPFLAP